MTLKPRARRASMTVESAFVFPVLVFFILAIIVGAAGIFRYQEVCYVAHEGARYASVHGAEWAAEQNTTAATPQDVYNNAIQPGLMTLDPSQVGYSVTWNQNNYPSSVVGSYEKPVVNTVTVTITYNWIPEWGPIGAITFTGTSTLPMTH
jgi:hypothetical protein